MAIKALKKRVAIKVSPRVGGLVKRDARSPAFGLRGDRVFIKAGTRFGSTIFASDIDIVAPADGYRAGGDYGVFVSRGRASAKEIVASPRAILPPTLLGGFHFAPGGNASAESGGDNIARVNHRSFWDRNFRPACRDPRGMVFITGEAGAFWCDIYLTGADHLEHGTSRFGAKIADGNNPPQDPAGGRFKKFDYATAQAVMAHHGKGLLSAIEFFAVAYGVTEKSAHAGDPVTTGLDASRTSKFGLMQATGNMWVWGHCGHPTQPRASIFGGSLILGQNAGSRYAYVAYHWPGLSHDNIGARGRSDHMQLA